MYTHDLVPLSNLLPAIPIPLLIPMQSLRTDGRQEAAGAEEVLWSLDHELALMQESMMEDPFSIPIYEVTFCCEQAARRLRAL